MEYTTKILIADENASQRALLKDCFLQARCLICKHTQAVLICKLPFQQAIWLAKICKKYIYILKYRELKL